MDTTRPVWLVNNTSSGSNDAAALTALIEGCVAHGFHVAHRTVFPETDLPTPALLEAAEIGCVVAFAGDGTVNALLGALEGWSGAVLVLAGGTMNLLYHRLHGERTVEQVLELAGRGAARLHRPGVIRSAHGVAYAGVLAGPGASWGDVREAMREKAVLELAGSAVKAVRETVAGEMIVCRAPPLGRSEGYPLINLTPTDEGIEIDAYSAETTGDYLAHGVALLKRNFREGPHDQLGVEREVRLASSQGSPFGLLIDGEEMPCGAEEAFTLVQAGVDLLATI